MSTSVSRRVYLCFIVSAIALLGIFVIGTIGYRLIGGARYSLIDCFYMTFLTVATVGFHEIVDLQNNPGGRLFTVAIGLSGIASMSVLFSTLVAFIVENDLNQVFWRRKMQTDIKKLRDHFILCGIGRIGGNVAHELLTTHLPFVIIDDNMENINHYLEYYPDQFYVHGNACDDEILIKAGIAKARGVFAVTGDDSKNLVISLTVKQLNPQARVVARCHDVKNIEKTRKAGADAIVSPDYTGGLRLAAEMMHPHVASFFDEILKSDSNLRIEEISLPPSFSSQPLSKLDLKSPEYLFLALREKGHWIINPSHDKLLHSGNTLIVMTTPQGKKRLEQELLR